MSKKPFAKTDPVNRTGKALRAFASDEDGTLVVFGLVLLVLMVMVGGIAVDVMRFETQRTTLQNTLDRSTLAAASLTQDLEPTAVVNDYFAKAGILDTLREVNVTQGLNFRNVNASASADTNPIFMHMVNVPEMDAHSMSTAEQRINNVEIMLILDVSGSMNSNNRITNLKKAAKDFVDTVLRNDVDNKISIGIVPFNGQVNLGPTLAAKFNVTDKHGYSNRNCVDLPSSAYSSLTISRTAALSQTANADTYSGSGTTSPSENNKWCPTSTGNIVRMPIQNATTLKSYIDALSPVGATSINAGMKWGVALMNPAMQGLYDEYMTAGAMPATMVGRPLAYDHDDAMKVIVLMTDGEHFAEERVDPAYKTGASPIWKANGDGRYSIFHANKVDNRTSTTICNSRPFYVLSSDHQSGSWQSRPWNGSTPSSSACYVPSTTSYSNTTRQSWPQVWEALNMQRVAYYFFAKPLGSSTSTWMNNFRDQTATTTMDNQLQAICDLAKEQNTLVYGIAFEAPSGGQTQIRNCASSVAHYFNASGLQISSAFSAIANNISQLRLTQ